MATFYSNLTYPLVSLENALHVLNNPKEYVYMGTKYYNSYSEMVEDKPVAGTKGVVHPISLVMEFDGTKWGSAGGGSVLSESEWIKLGEYYTTVDPSVTGIDNTFTVANAISALDAAVTDIKINATLNGVNLFHNGEWGQEIYADYIWCSDATDRNPETDSVAAILKQLRVDVDNIQNNSSGGNTTLNTNDVVLTTEGLIGQVFSEEQGVYVDGIIGPNGNFVEVRGGGSPPEFTEGMTLNAALGTMFLYLHDFSYYNLEDHNRMVYSVNGIEPDSGAVQLYGIEIPMSSDDGTAITDVILQIKADIEELQNNSGSGSGGSGASITDDITISIGTGAGNPGVGYYDGDGNFINGYTGEIMPTNWDPGWNSSTTLSQALAHIAYFSAMTEESHVNFRMYTVQSVNDIKPDTSDPSQANGALYITGENIPVSSDSGTTIAEKFAALNATYHISSVNGIGFSNTGTSDITITGQDITLSSDDPTTIYDKITEVDSKCFKIRMNDEELYPSQDENGYNWIDLYSPRIEEINIETLSIYGGENGLHKTLADVINNLNISLDRQYGSSQLFLPADNLEFQNPSDEIIPMLASMGLSTAYDDSMGSYYPYVLRDVIDVLIRKAASSLTTPDYGSKTVSDNNGSSIECNRLYSVVNGPGYIVVNITSEQISPPVYLEINGNTILNGMHYCMVPINAGDTFYIGCTIGDHSMEPIEIAFIPCTGTSGYVESAQ